MIEMAEVDGDLRKLAPKWVAYLEEQADAVNSDEQTFEDAYRNIVRFAMKGIVDILAQAVVRGLNGPSDYRTKRAIVRVLGHRIRQLRREESRDA